jgi:cytidine deaminase
MLTSEQIRVLVGAAVNAIDIAFVYPPGRTRCGASVLTNQGSVFAAANYFSASQTLTVHAEQAALVHAAAHGEPLIKAIAVVCSTGSAPVHGLSRPCGLCLQVLRENGLLNEGCDIQVVMCNLEGNYEIHRMSELLPFGWPSEIVNGELDR